MLTLSPYMARRLFKGYLRLYIPKTPCTDHWPSGDHSNIPGMNLNTSLPEMNVWNDCECAPMGVTFDFLSNGRRASFLRKEVISIPIYLQPAPCLYISPSLDLKSAHICKHMQELNRSPLVLFAALPFLDFRFSLLSRLIWTLPDSFDSREYCDHQ